MLKQLVSRLGHGKQSFHMCNTKSPYLATFVLSLLLFQSACNRETSSKCKKGSFLRISPKTADVTTPSFTGSACQDSDSLPFFPSLSPPRYWPSRPPRRRRRTHPWTRARKSPAHICSTSLLSLPPCCLLVSQQRFTTCYEERSEPHSWQDTRLSQGKYQWGRMKGERNEFSKVGCVRRREIRRGRNDGCLWIDQGEDRERAAAVPVWPQPPGFWGQPRPPPV